MLTNVVILFSGNKETLEELIAQGPSSVSILSADADDQDALVGLVGGGRRKQKCNVKL